LGRVSRR